VDEKSQLSELLSRSAQLSLNGRALRCFVFSNADLFI
jgi:hypothetical protein